MPDISSSATVVAEGLVPRITLRRGEGSTGSPATITDSGQLALLEHGGDIDAVLIVCHCCLLQTVYHRAGTTHGTSRVSRAQWVEWVARVERVEWVNDRSFSRRGRLSERGVDPRCPTASDASLSDRRCPQLVRVS